ncbi:hypothetical protein J6590_096888 [Homalodisca vitripennis]|nr:hypothetical protein J6590_096888 [Homalodisca vitripennis]
MDNVTAVDNVTVTDVDDVASRFRTSELSINAVKEPYRSGGKNKQPWSRRQETRAWLPMLDNIASSASESEEVKVWSTLSWSDSARLCEHSLLACEFLLPEDVN